MIPYDLTLRKFHLKQFGTDKPSLSPLSSTDIADHLSFLRSIQRKAIKGPVERQRAFEGCYERFVREFSGC